MGPLALLLTLSSAAAAVPEPHVVDAFASYAGRVDGFAAYHDTVESFASFDASVDAFASEGEV